MGRAGLSETAAAGIGAPVRKPFVRSMDILFGVALLGVVLWFLADFPILRPWLTAGFAIYALCLWRWPKLWLVVVPALLPTFDLAPWSGRFFFNEFDAVVLLTAGILILHERNSHRAAIARPGLNLILVLLAASYAVALAIRLWPLPPVTINSFADYYSPFNSLRVAKGFAWSMLLYRPLKKALVADSNARLLLCIGFIAGLTGVDAAAIVERWMFPGLWTLDTDYRVSSTFSSMHTGDGPIDVWLAVSIPMLAVLMLNRQRWRLLPLGVVLLLAALYTLFATQSRAPAVALVVECGAALIAVLVISKRHRWLIGTIVTSGALLAALAISQASIPRVSFIQRFAGTEGDAQTRLTHWRNALHLRDDTVAAGIFGMGLGSYPLLHQVRSTEPHAARYMFRSDGSGSWLTMWSGQALYMGQSVPIAPHTRYHVSMKVRTADANASVVILWCELWLLSSQNCLSKDFQLQPTTDAWTTLSTNLDSGDVGRPLSMLGMRLQRPMRFTFFVSNAARSGVDFGLVSVRNAQNREMVRNGDFRQGGDEWFWAEDDHLAWHVKNLAVAVLLEQGWLGIVAIGSLLLYTLAELWRQVVRGDPLSPILVASMTGFVITAVTVSTFDEPRLALMFYLLCFTIVWGSQSSRWLEILKP